VSYAVEWSDRAEKQLAKLDRQIARSLVRFMNERVHQSQNPRHIGKQLKDSAFWRYRVGEYRILCLIEDRRLVVLVVEVGYPREIYRR
jgi:mRNA interferase RelE/StbE